MLPPETGIGATTVEQNIQGGEIPPDDPENMKDRPMKHLDQDGEDELLT